MSALAVTIDRERCDGCWACVRSCPTAALEARAREGVAEILWNCGRCIFCGRCEMVCPKHAVRRATPLETGDREIGLTVLVQLPDWVCAHCGASFGAGVRSPRPEVAVEAIERGRGLLCPRCRQREAFRAELGGRGEGDRC